MGFGKKRGNNIAKKFPILLMVGILFYYTYFFAYENTDILDFFLSETIPLYKANASDENLLYKVESQEGQEAFTINLEQGNIDKTVDEISPVFYGETKALEGEAENQNANITELIGVDDIMFQPETDSTLTEEDHTKKENITSAELNKLKDINYLKKNFYTVDSRTALTPDLFNVDKFLSTDLKIKSSKDEPKVLIFHTHIHEAYKDSDPNNVYDGVAGVGEKVVKDLETKYGIKSIHDVTRYDVVDGRTQIMGAYERMEVNIKKILKDNPSIEVVIDIHRDGVARDDIVLAEDINGKRTAQIMFFNGLTKLYKNGKLEDIPNLSNPNLLTNLAFSFNMQLNANEMYPHLTRKVYLNAYRYSLHMMPKSLLIEVGAQTNTKAEAFNAGDYIADILAKTILK